MPTLSSKIITGGAAIALLLLIFFLGYVSGKASLATSIGEITGKVEQQKVHAKQVLDTLTAERDEKQTVIDNTYREMEKKDAQAKNAIDRLTAELGQRPVRVRIDCPSGNSSSGSQNKTTTAANAGARNTHAAYGVLPAANSQRLASAINEIEQLNAAYTSCRQALDQRM